MFVSVKIDCDSLKDVHKLLKISSVTILFYCETTQKTSVRLMQNPCSCPGSKPRVNTSSYYVFL